MNRLTYLFKPYKVLALFVFLLLDFFSVAQTKNYLNSEASIAAVYSKLESKSSNANAGVFYDISEVDTSPKLSGSEISFNQRIMLNGNANAYAKSYVKVVLEFDLTAKGEMVNVNIGNNVPEEYKRITFETISSFPKWQPGKVGIDNVNVKGCTFTFNLDLNKYEDINLFKKSESETIITNPDVVAQFPHGNSQFLEYISSNLNYPIESYNASISGAIKVKFIIDKDGNVKDATILKGLDEACNAEALRIISSMPHWIPAMVENEKVNSEVTQFVWFRL